MPKRSASTAYVLLVVVLFLGISALAARPFLEGGRIASTGKTIAQFPAGTLRLDSPSHCTNGAQDGDEAGEDCGGSCQYDCKTYFVDANNGNDVWSGRYSHPWKTISKSLASVSAGETVLFRDGSYGAFNLNLLANHTDWITFKADDGSKPVLDSVYVNGNDVDAYLRFDGIEVLLPVQPSCVNYGNTKNIVDFEGASHIEFLNGKVHASRTYDAGVGIWFDGKSSPIHDIFINNTEVTRSGFGIRFKGYSIVISNNYLHHLQATVIGSAPGNPNGAWNVVIDNNTILDAHGDFNEPCYDEGNWSETHASAIAIRGPNFTVTNNKIGNVRLGVQFYQDSGAGYTLRDYFFENNTMYDTDAPFYFYNPGILSGPMVVRHNTFIAQENPNAGSTSNPLFYRFANSLNIDFSKNASYNGTGTIFRDNIFINYDFYLATRSNENFNDSSAKWVAENNLLYNKGMFMGSLNSSNIVLYNLIKSGNLPQNYLDNGLFVKSNFTAQANMDCIGTDSCDFRPRIGSIACNMSSTGGYVGSLPCVDECPSGYAADVSQYNITWYFDKCYRVGQFVNGDWWVVIDSNTNAVNVTKITPQPGGTGTGYRNGSMVNPVPGNVGEGDGQAYDGRNGEFNPLKVIDVPMKILSNKSLISTESLASTPYTDVTGSSISATHTKTAAILTVLDSVPPSNTLRPAYAGSNKVIYTLSDVNWGVLPALQPVSSQPDTQLYKRIFQRPWIDHLTNWMGRVMHPADNMPNYGRDIAGAVGDAGLLLTINNVSLADKKQIAIGLIQIGIDTKGVVDLNPTIWEAVAGQNVGRKFPYVFAAFMLNSSSFINQSAIFSEDDSTYYGNSTDPEQTLWTGWQNSGNPYSSNVLYLFMNGLDNQGRPWYHENYNPAMWSKQPFPNNGNQYPFDKHEGYRRVASVSFSGQAIAARIFGMQHLWNHTEFFSYTDRWMYENDTPIRAIIIDESNKAGLPYDVSAQGGNGWSSFATNMYLVYRPLFNTSSCVNNIQDGNETSTDCGGSCPACTSPVNCTDGIRNQDETGIDCGGSCPACATTPGTPDQPGGGSPGGGSIPTGACIAGQKSSCGSNTGKCKNGTHTCSSGQWGSCIGAITPSAEACNGIDDDCNGKADDGITCDCIIGQTRACGASLGACLPGTRTCANGAWSLECAGEKGPAAEVCGNGIDDNCDGAVDEADCIGFSTITCSDGIITKPCTCEGKTYTEGYCYNRVYSKEKIGKDFPWWQGPMILGGGMITITLLVLSFRKLRSGASAADS